MDEPGMALKGKKVLVTGATGFVGGALAARLAGLGAEVTGTGTRLARGAWLEDRGVRLVRLDLAAPESFPEVVAGFEVVLHLAAFTGAGSADRALRLNTEAPATLLRAASGAKRFVHVSTCGVYGLPDDDRVTEDTPPDTAQADDYERTKARGEVALALAAEDVDVEVVIVRPGMVYGPRSYAWTVGMLKLVKRGTPVLLGRARGNAFPVYVDNLVDALLLAATVPEAAGGTFHVVDAPVPWVRWFGYYGDMCGRKPRRLPGFLAWPLALAAEKLPLGLPLSRSRLAFLDRALVFPTDHAQSVLGWAPRVGVDDGMRRSEAWLREEGRL